jgi:hypothetical protein
VFLFFARMRVFQSSFFVLAAASSWQDFEFKELKEILEEHVPDESIKGRGPVMARAAFLCRIVVIPDKYWISRGSETTSSSQLL